MQSRSRFIESVPSEFPALVRSPNAPDVSFGRSDGARLDRVKQLAIENTRQRIAQIESTIGNFGGMVTTLEGAIEFEQNQTGIRDPAHFAYSKSAMSMIQRRDNLNHSIDELKRQLGSAKLELE
jgi:flagellar protein FliJ